MFKIRLLQKYRHNKGFTLIELLVVISIVSLLSSTVLATTNLARAKARDAQRVAQLRQIQNALEQYYDDHGFYPQGLGFSPWDSWGWPINWENPDGRRPTPMRTLISGGHISSVPDDPINREGGAVNPYLLGGPTDDLGYIYCSNDAYNHCPLVVQNLGNQAYVLGTNLESKTLTSYGAGNYQLSNQQGTSWSPPGNMR